MTTFTCGAIKSPYNPDDLIAEHIYPSARDLNLPDKLDLRSNLQGVRDQGSQGTCVAQSIACMKEWQEKTQVNLSEYMSPQFVYNNRSNYPSPGMYCSNAMKILNTLGCCTEYNYHYGTTEPIPKPAMDEALRYKVKSYAQITTLVGVQTALYKNGPCIVAFPAYNYGPQFWVKGANDKLIGGHCVTIVGYDKEKFIIRNSWGTKWNDGGYTYYPYSQFGSHWEIWTSIDDESPKPDPHPAECKCIII